MKIKTRDNGPFGLSETHSRPSRAVQPLLGARPAGYVVYKVQKVGIPPEAVDAKFVETFEYLVGVIEPAWKIPNPNECRFCDIARTECPERIES